MSTADTQQPPPAVLPLSVERLEKVINDTLGTNGKIVETDCEVIAQQKGFMSIITKIKIKWDNDADELPRSVITKKPTLEIIKNIPAAKDFIDDPEMLKKLHNRECDAYAFFLAKKTPPIPLAKLYFAERITDEDPNSGLLVLEDLSETGQSLGFNEDTSLEKIMVIVEHIATLQAYGFNHPEYKDSLFKLPLDFADRMFDTDTAADAAEMRKIYPDKFKMTDEEALELRQKAKDDIDMTINPEVHGRTPVLSLGDVQPNNILWKLSPDGSLSDQVAAFLDFQLASVRSCSFDIGSIMVMNMSVGVRKANQERIFEHYLATLKANSECDDTKITINELRECMASQERFRCFSALRTMKSFGDIAAKIGIAKERESELVDRVLAGLHVT